MKRIKIKLLKPLRGHLVGTIKRIQVDKNGIPLERYWRDRLKDAKLDGCIEIVKNKKSKGD